MGRWRKSLGRLSLVLAALTVLSPAQASDLSNSEILRNFDVIAFHNEVRRVTNPRVTKWTQPIRAYKQLNVIVKPRVEAFLDRHMERLAEVTGLEIDFVGSSGEANFLIILTRRRDYLRTALKHITPGKKGVPAGIVRRLRNTNCLGVFSVERSSGGIERAVVVIPVDHARSRGILNRCIVEETTQAMGLPNDSDDVNPSVFNDRSRLKDLSSHDLLLLRLLYHPDLPAGMPRREALATAARILPTMRRD